MQVTQFCKCPSSFYLFFSACRSKAVLWKQECCLSSFFPLAEQNIPPLRLCISHRWQNDVQFTTSEKVFELSLHNSRWLHQVQTAVWLNPVFLNICWARKGKFYWKFTRRKYLILQLVLWCLLKMSQSELLDWAQSIQSGLNLSRSCLFSISKPSGLKSSHSTTAEVIYMS